MYLSSFLVIFDAVKNQFFLKKFDKANTGIQEHLSVLIKLRK